MRSHGAPRHLAARVAAPRRVELVEVETRPPGPGEVRIGIEGCGLCASSLPFWEGREWFDYPGPPGGPGHEGWGIVEAIGPGVEAVKPGDRVAAISHRAFAERDYAPESAVTVLPSSLDGRPFPGEALGCAVNVFRRARVRAGHQVAVVGSGFLGTLLIGLVAAAGARVVAVSRRDSSRALARRFGAEAAFPLNDRERVIREVERRTGGALCDRVIEATGKEDPLALAAALTRVRGRLIVAGFHQDGPRRVDLQLWNWRGLDVINAHERDPAAYVRGMQAAGKAFAPHRLDPTPLYSHVVPLDRIEEAFRLLERRPEGFMKALVTMWGGGGE